MRYEWRPAEKGRMAAPATAKMRLRLMDASLPVADGKGRAKHGGECASHLVMATDPFPDPPTGCSWAGGLRRALAFRLLTRGVGDLFPCSPQRQPGLVHPGSSRGPRGAPVAGGGLRLSVFRNVVRNRVRSLPFPPANACAASAYGVWKRRCASAPGMSGKERAALR